MGSQRVRQDWTTFTFLLDHPPYLFGSLRETQSSGLQSSVSFQRKLKLTVLTLLFFFFPLNSASHLLNSFLLKHYLFFCPWQLDTELLSNMHNPSFPHHHHHSQLRYYQEEIITHWIFKSGMLQDNFKYSKTITLIQVQNEHGAK